VEELRKPRAIGVVGASVDSHKLNR